ncbi:MAG: 50S ribosome-binding GTPase [Planctomycetia bacterium]|nr:50S ribosome-binding GTPase [Planctomycetia bacterium]
MMPLEYWVTTPPGRGAIAVVEVSGAKALAAVEDFFCAKSGKRVSEASFSAIQYGVIGREDVIVCPVDARKVEIHCHGSHAAVTRILKELAKRGGVEKSREAYWEEKYPDPYQRRAAALLPYAVTEKTAGILWDQYHGAERRAMERHENLEQWRSVAEHLTKPWKVVLVGRPNSGKSSLFNAILGFSRAMVYEQAGTTRDVLRERTVLSGWSVELWDTAGLRETNHPIEREGVRRAEEATRQADLVVWVRNLEQPDGEEPAPKVLRKLTVWNKCDIPHSEPAEGLCVSARTGEGMEAFLAAMIRVLVPEEPPPGTGIPISDL